MQPNIKRIYEQVEQLYAIELLEYHNKTKLAGDNKTRSEDRQRALQSIMRDLKNFSEEV